MTDERWRDTLIVIYYRSLLRPIRMIRYTHMHTYTNTYMRKCAYIHIHIHIHIHKKMLMSREEGGDGA